MTAKQTATAHDYLPSTQFREDHSGILPATLNILSVTNLPPQALQCGGSRSRRSRDAASRTSTRCRVTFDFSRPSRQSQSSSQVAAGASPSEPRGGVHSCGPGVSESVLR